LDGLLARLEQSRAVVGVEVGVYHRGGDLARQRQQHRVTGRPQPPRPGPITGAEGIEQRLLDGVLAQQGQAEVAGRGRARVVLPLAGGPVTSTRVTPPPPGRARRVARPACPCRTWRRRWRAGVLPTGQGGRDAAFPCERPSL